MKLIFCHIIVNHFGFLSWNVSYCSYFFSWAFFFLFKENIEGGKRETDFPFGGFSPNAWDWSWARPTASSMWVSHVAGRHTRTCFIIFCFHKNINRNLDQKLSSQDSKQHVDMRCRGHKQWLNPPHQNAGPLCHFKFSDPLVLLVGSFPSVKHAAG